VSIASVFSCTSQSVICRIFEFDTELMKLFKFDKADLKSNAKFRAHADSMVDMMDMAVSLLGPDLDPLAEDLVDLGQRHIAYGVKLEYLPIMERAVLHAMEEMIPKFSSKDRKSWELVFHFMISNMIKGMR
jgi:hemoglobin-like flavoprotein